MRQRARFLVLLTCAAAALSAGRAVAAPGELDPGFGTGGIVRVANEFYGFDAVAIQTDGKIVTARTADSYFALARYRRDGSLDRSFGVDGNVTTRFRGRHCTSVNAVAVQPGGQIVAAGRAGACDASAAFALARYRPNGRLDRSFGRRGKVITRFGRRCAYAEAAALGTQKDGRIVAAGTGCIDRRGRHTAFALARYTPDGRLDRSFGGDGRVTTNFVGRSEVASDMVIQPDGRIVAVGTARLAGHARFALARYNVDGSQDTSFAGDGRRTDEFTDQGRPCTAAIASAATIQADGRIVAAGQASCGFSVFALARYDPDGRLDTSFDGDGRVTTDVKFDTPHRYGCSDSASDVAIQADGKIVAGGTAGCRRSDIGLAVTRFGTGGSLDTGFGDGGKVTTIVGTPSPSCYSQLDAIALQPDGMIVGAGVLTCTPGDRPSPAGYDAVLVRYRGG